MIAGMIGGTVSAATGGKFANGAVTSAFQWAFSEGARSGREKSPLEGHALDTELTKEQRQALFDEAVVDLKARGLIGDHKITFDNRFALAKLSANGSIADTKLFNTEDALYDFWAENTGDYLLLDGATVLGSKYSTIYAGATASMSGPMLITGGSKVINFSSGTNMRFTIMHEISHGTGVRLEPDANASAMEALGL